MIISNVSNCTYGDSVAINIDLSRNDMPIDEGILNIKIGEQTYSAEVNDGKATITIPNLNAGTYTENVTFSSDNYNNSTQEVTFEVFKSNAQMQITPENCNYKESITINIDLTGNNMAIDEGIVQIKIGNQTYSTEVNDGKATLMIPNMNAGTYTGNVTFNSDNYNNSTQEVTFKVFKSNAQMEVTPENCNYGESIAINIDLSGNNIPIDEGSVNIKIGEQTYSAEVNDGKATITIPNLNAGTYTGNVTFSSDNYNNSTKEVTFEVAKSNAQMQITPENCNYKESITLNIDLSGNNQIIDDSNVYIKIGEQTYSAEVNDGKATITIPNLNAGSYSENVTFSSANYNSTQQVTFEVAKSNAQIEATAENSVYGESALINIDLTGNNIAIDEGSVNIKIGNQTYSTEVNDGKATLMIPNMNAGTYTGNVTFSSDNYNNSTKEVTFEVAKSNAQMEITADNCDYGENITIKVLVSDPNTVNDGTITLKINNENYTEELTSKGFVIFTLSNMTAGTYNANISYDGGLNHNTVIENITFDVYKQKASITANAKAYVINYGGKYFITLKDINGNVLSGEKVTFTLNGKDIGSATTNSQGVAVIGLNAKVLKAVKAGKKNLIIKLSSDNYQASKTVKITVNKEKTKITAKKKTFKKAKKVKKYSVTLKNSKGKAVKNVKVILKVKGKTFKAKTTVKVNQPSRLKN